MLTLDDGGSGSVSLLIIVIVSCLLAKHCTILSVLNNVAWMVFKAVRSAPISLWVLIILLLIRSVLAEILDVRSLTLTITTKRKQKNVTSVRHLLDLVTRCDPGLRPFLPSGSRVNIAILFWESRRKKDICGQTPRKICSWLIVGKSSKNILGGKM